MFLFTTIAVVVCISGLVSYIDRSQFQLLWPDIRRIADSIPDEELHLPRPQRPPILKLLSPKELDAQSQLDWRVSR